jgi:hypothetical protein
MGIAFLHGVLKHVPYEEFAFPAIHFFHGYGVFIVWIDRPCTQRVLVNRFPKGRPYAGSFVFVAARVQRVTAA